MPDQPDDPGDERRDDAALTGEEAGERHTGLPDRVERWRRRSATGAIMTGFAFGLQEVFEPERKGPSIVQETSGDPPEDLAVDADMDPIAAARTVVRIRPWLLEGATSPDAPAAGDHDADGHGPAEGPDPAGGR